jgi:Nucleotidyltransferase domain
MDPLVTEAVGAYLELVDAAVPDLVQGLYLVGSVALDDFRPGTSDVDFVAVTADPVTDLAALARVHRTLAARRGRPVLDGGYVTWCDLAGDPADAGPGLTVHGGRVRTRPAGGCDPVAWHTLADHGVAIRGPGRVEVWTDVAALARWTRRNLDGYWRPWLRRSSRLLSRPGLACVSAWGPAWGVLGVSRLHYTLGTGAITSKCGAGRYAREVFGPEWLSIVDECLRIRGCAAAPRRYRDPLARRRAALEFVAMAIDEAKAL